MNEQDNKPERTALMTSIQRKKDLVKVLKLYAKSAESELEIMILEREIVEDEKLLKVERLNIIDAHGVKSTSRFLDSPLVVTGEWYYNKKYGTDGK